MEGGVAAGPAGTNNSTNVTATTATGGNGGAAATIGKTAANVKHTCTVQAVRLQPYPSVLQAKKTTIDSSNTHLISFLSTSLPSIVAEKLMIYRAHSLISILLIGEVAVEPSG